ncbi:MAG: alpha/beta hydrolase [Acutalibacteraceae bacterium]
MARNKYEYKTDLKLFSYFNPPVIISVLPFMQRVMRSFYLLQLPDKSLESKTFYLTSPDGGRFKVILYIPENASKENSPLIIFYHGGGFVYNAAPHHFAMAKRFAKELNVKVAFVDYRLAPKHPFPAAVEDALCAYEYFLTYSDKQGIDKNKIVLCGDSAGGNLAAVVSLNARDRGLIKPCGQMLLYPFVDADNETESMLKYTDTPMCNSVAVKGYSLAYLPKEGYKPAEYFSVVDAPSLSNLPEAYIEVAEFDCLRDGGIKLYRRLLNESGSAELFDVKGSMHGYDIAIGSETVKKCNKKRYAFFKKVFEK